MNMPVLARRLAQHNMPWQCTEQATGGMLPVLSLRYPVQLRPSLEVCHACRAMLWMKGSCKEAAPTQPERTYPASKGDL